MSQLVNAMQFSPANNAVVEEFQLPAYVCVIDAKRRNEENIRAYTEQQRTAANKLLAAVEYAYPSSDIYLNYRQKFVAIKANAPQRRDILSSEAVKLDIWAAANNVVIERTRYGHIIYRITAQQLSTFNATGLAYNNA